MFTVLKNSYYVKSNCQQFITESLLGKCFNHAMYLLQHGTADFSTKLSGNSDFQLYCLKIRSTLLVEMTNKMH
jgi:hypothetical protein